MHSIYDATRRQNPMTFTNNVCPNYICTLGGIVGSLDWVLAFDARGMTLTDKGQCVPAQICVADVSLVDSHHPSQRGRAKPTAASV